MLHQSKRPEVPVMSLPNFEGDFTSPAVTKPLAQRPIMAN